MLDGSTVSTWHNKSYQTVGTHGRKEITMHINRLNAESAQELREEVLEDLEAIDSFFLPTQGMEIRIIIDLCLRALDELALETDELETLKVLHRGFGFREAYLTLMGALPEWEALMS